MKKLIFFFLLLPIYCLAQAPIDTVHLDEGNFQVAWSHSARYPVKVCWTLTPEMLNCTDRLKRTDKFTVDPQLPAETNLQKDYTNSKYDRGHNFNAADDACADSVLNLNCWRFSNMAAQDSNLNRITWRN